MGSVSPNYVDDIYDKKSLGYGPALFSNMADGGHLELQLVSLDISFSMVLRNFYTKGDHCIRI